MIDLSRFCSTEDARANIQTPWTREGYTWATNGALMIAVPQQADVTRDDGPNGAALIRQAKELGLFASLIPAPPIPELAPARETCPCCKGAGVVDPYELDVWDAPWAEAYPKSRQPVRIGAAIFAGHLVSLVWSLPGLRISTPTISANSPTKTTAIDRSTLAFTFDGKGVGLLMGMRGDYPNAIVLIDAPAAA